MIFNLKTEYIENRKKVVKKLSIWIRRFLMNVYKFDIYIDKPTKKRKKFLKII
jgi:hypothetical protein